MSKIDENVSTEEIDMMHEGLLRSADARAQLPHVDFDRISKLALDAYAVSKRQETTAEQGNAFSADADSETQHMKQRAAGDLARLAGQDSVMDEPRRGFTTDLVAAFVVPVILVGLVYMLVMNLGSEVGSTALVIFLAILAGIAIATARRLFGSRSSNQEGQFSKRRPGLFSSQSSGAVAAGALVLLAGGLTTLYVANRQSEEKFMAGIEQLNTAMVWAIVESATDLTWKLAERQPAQAGMLLASARFPQRALDAEVRLSEDPSVARYSQLAAALKLRSGETKYTDYLTGRVIATRLKSLTLEPAPGVKREIELPKGMPAPPLESVVVVALKKGTDQATFVQPIDTAVKSLKMKYPY
jgi:hypothetical protein